MTWPAARIVRGTAVHLDRWSQLRALLWSDGSEAEHRDDIAAMVAHGKGHVAFLALDVSGDAIGFVEAALRHDYVNGCDTSPVLFVEGLYVEPDARRSGAARALIDAVTAWGRAQGCSEMASDADITNLSSHDFHNALGFLETERVVYFRKVIA
ncbi:aminoglycoside 6'-N-acetyltransferase [Sphingobium sp. CR2-8]|uniref:aminoglycoside 6'-N-acetyltransferase n=1 Tax=Sphingobium sp. CR2-8 TaxID=1306534 RepID=UPI002DB9DE9E|nr:aminoglycoside 6'-N-acetyltransferase [Sphingobium sp. CR2-8]MEC3911335.1 aminoglycoside 6'-N-acetyltransferase [Sphingobium sp. CR2-8]